jgi:hypothetical protein
MARVETFREQFDRPIVRNFIVLILFFVLACLQGYEFGTGDLALYLPYVMHLHDPSLFTGDLLITSLSAYGAPLWHVVAWLLNFGDVKTVFFVLFLFQTAVITAGFRFFYRRFFGDNSGWMVFLLLLTMARSSGAMNTFGLNPFSYFQPCGLALGMLMFLYGFLDSGKYKTAGVIAGTMFLYHPISAVWACLLFLLRSITGTGRVNSCNKLSGGLVLFLCASPYIISYVQGNIIHPHEPVAAGLWVELARMRLNHAFFLSRWVPDRFVQMGLVFAGIMIFFRHPAFLRTLPIVIATLIALVATAFGELVSSRMILQLNLLRCTYLEYILFFAFLAFRVSQIDHLEAPIRKVIWTVLCLLLVVMPYLEHHRTIFSYCLIGTVLMISIGTGLKKIGQFQKIIVASGLVMVAIITAINVDDRHKSTGRFFAAAGTGSWHDIQVWVRDNTPRGSRVVTPVYLEGFRSYSVHSIYGDWKDGGSHQFCNITIREWWERMQSLGITLGMKSDLFPKVYHENALAAARKADGDYVVYDKRYARCVGQPMYENDRFGIVVPSDSVQLVPR